MWSCKWLPSSSSSSIIVRPLLHITTKKHLRPMSNLQFCHATSSHNKVAVCNCACCTPSISNKQELTNHVSQFLFVQQSCRLWETQLQTATSLSDSCTTNLRDKIAGVTSILPSKMTCLWIRKTACTTGNYHTQTTLVAIMFLLTFTFKLSSVSSSSMTRHVNGFIVTDASQASALTFSWSVCCCFLDFLLNARGMSRDKADSIFTQCDTCATPYTKHATPGLRLQRPQKLMISCLSTAELIPH